VKKSKINHRSPSIPLRSGVAAMAFLILSALPAPVFSGFVPPTLTKSFAPTTINSGGTTVLTFTITNLAGAPAVSNVGSDHDSR
jgi:hypothetical protein